MKFEITQTPGAEWDEFVSRYTDVLFYYSIWGEVLKQGLDAKLSYSYIRDKGEILGGMPGILLTYPGLRIFYCSLPYGGYIGEISSAALFVREFMSRASSSDIIHVLPYSEDPQTGYSSYLKSKKTAISRMDISGKQIGEIEKRYPGSLKRSIKTARRRELGIKTCNDSESMQHAYLLYRQTMRRNRAIEKYPATWFTSIARILGERGLASLYMVDSRGIPIAAAIVVHSGKGSHLLHVMSNTSYLSLCPNDFMIHEIIRNEIEKRGHFIDFLHSDPADKNLIWWKNKFGFDTNLVNNYFHLNSQFKSAIWNGLKKIYPIISSVVGTDRI